MSTFRSDTRLPISSLTFLSRLKARYDCGPIVGLDEEQAAMLETFDALYPRDKFLALHAAAEAGRDHLLGSDLIVLAFAPWAVAGEQPAEETEQ